ncbi:MAG: TraC family protein, partial [Xanthomonadales bacterium]|nr:TraC family protein [Xanthomonadales bacterium]
MKDLLALFGLTATPAAPSEADVALRPVTRRRLARDQYTRPPSFTDLLPWCEYLPDHQAFLLEDGRSVG